jgi:hypothetical protein
MREAMARKGHSFRTLSFLTDLDPGYLCRIASGERRPSKDAALKIARILSLNPRTLRNGGAR